MRSSQSNIRRGWWSVLLGITVLFSSLPARAEGLREKTPPGFRDGEWVASFSMYTTMKTDVTTIKTNYKGVMGLISSGGQVNGEWTLSGTGKYTGDITGLAYFDGAGKISGPATEPQISTSSFVVDLAINVAGMPLTLISSTCSQVIAGIEAPTSDAIGQAGVAGWVYERLLKAPRRRYR